MKRVFRLAMVAVPVLMLAAPSYAEVKTRDKSQVKFEGLLGKMFNLFGGKSAKEGIETRSAVKGNRKAVLSDTTGTIIDLSEEKVYELDIRKKEYRVKTFEQIRKEMREAAERAAKEAERAEPAEKSEPQKPTKEFEVDFDVKETGQKKQIAGYDTRNVIVTVTVREKNQTLDEAGGMVMTTDMWLAANAPSTNEGAEFDMRYAEKLHGPMTVSGASAQDMAMAMAMYPQMKPALDKMAAEGTKVEGTAILTEMKMEAVPPGTANTTAAAPAPAAEPEQKKGRFGGMLGGLKKMAEKGNQPSGESKPQRSVFMTTSVEMLKLTKDVTADAVALPAGLKESK